MRVLMCVCMALIEALKQPTSVCKCKYSYVWVGSARAPACGDAIIKVNLLRQIQTHAHIGERRTRRLRSTARSSCALLHALRSRGSPRRRPLRFASSRPDPWFPTLTSSSPSSATATTPIVSHVLTCVDVASCLHLFANVCVQVHACKLIRTCQGDPR
jgi:hypothetical protein